MTVCGSGSPLIMLHGFMSSKEAFASQIKFFSNYFTVVAYDLCGFGKNNRMPYPYKLDDYVNEFFSVADCFEGRVRVIGHSFGCRVILKAMAKSDKIERAVLCGPAGLGPKKSVKKTVKRCVYRLIRPLFGKKRLEKIFFSKDYNLLCDVQKQSFIYIVNEHLDGLLKQIDSPVFAVFGERDKQTPFKHVGKKLSQGIKNYGEYVMKGCDHFCFSERPNEFNYVIKEFLI